MEKAEALRLVNAWNAEKRWPRAFYREGNFCLDWSEDWERGVTPAILAHTCGQVLAGAFLFVEKLNEGDPASTLLRALRGWDDGSGGKGRGGSLSYPHLSSSHFKAEVRIAPPPTPNVLRPEQAPARRRGGGEGCATRECLSEATASYQPTRQASSPSRFYPFFRRGPRR